MVRWVPHQKMAVDPLTKPDPFKANGAMEAFLKTGKLCLVDVEDELKARATDPQYRRRSHATSAARLVQEYQTNFLGLWSTIIGGNCEESPVVRVRLCDT